jgi:hypothetical protein
MDPLMPPDLSSGVFPFVIRPGASVEERTRLLELWASVILKVGWETVRAAAPPAPEPFRLPWPQSARGNWWPRYRDWHVVVFQRPDGKWATRIQQDGWPALYLKATATEALWAMERLDHAFGRRFTSPRPMQCERLNDMCNFPLIPLLKGVSSMTITVLDNGMTVFHGSVG